MSKNKLTQDELDSYLCEAFTELRVWNEVHHKELLKEAEQAYKTIEEIIEKYFDKGPDWEKE